MLWLLIIGLISVNILSKSKVIANVDYSGLFPATSRYEKAMEHKKIIIVGDDLSILRHNELAGYFLDWNYQKNI